MQEVPDVVDRLEIWSRTYCDFIVESTRNQKQLVALREIFGYPEPLEALREVSLFIVEAKLFIADVCEQYPATNQLEPVFKQVSEQLVQRLNLSGGANAWAPCFSADGKSKLEMTVPMLRAIVGVAVAERRDEVTDRLRDFVRQFIDDPLDDSQLNADILSILTALLTAVERGDTEAIRHAEYRLRGTIFSAERNSSTFQKILNLMNGVAAALTILHSVGALELDHPAEEPPTAVIEVIEGIDLPIGTTDSMSEEE